MVDAVIVSTARTALTKSWRGAFNLTHGATLGAHVVQHAMERAQRRSGGDRRCAHGLRQSRRRHRLQHCAPDRVARRMSGDHLRHDGESLLLVGLADHRARRAAHHGGRRRDVRGRRRRIDFLRAERSPEHLHGEGSLARAAQAGDLLDDAADRGDRGAAATSISREAQDRYGVQSQQRAAAAQAAGLFADEIVPIEVVMGAADRDTGRLVTRKVTVSRGRGHPRRTLTTRRYRRYAPRRRAA